VPIEGSEQVPAVYHLAPLAQAVDGDLADDWVALLRSPAGQAALNRAGFLGP
jgi:hypothetical protein